MARSVKVMDMMLERPAEEGARVFVTCASAGTGFHGQYVSDGKVAEPSHLVRSEKGRRI